MADLSLFWLRIACVLYGVGLADSLFRIVRREPLFRDWTIRSFAAGAIFHFVAVTELSVQQQHLAANNFYETASLCAFLFAAVYLVIQTRYEFPSLSIFVFPLVFVLTLIGSLGVSEGAWADPRVRNAWLLTHIVLVLAGYAGLVVAAAGAVIYLVGERRLKKKGATGWSGLAMPGQLPPLETLDRLITQAMSLGFVAVTLAVVAASIYASRETGTRWISEPKIAVSLLTWGFYLVMVFLRISAGWRGRKAALLAIMVLAFGALTWAAHVGLRPLLIGGAP